MSDSGICVIPNNDTAETAFVTQDGVRLSPGGTAPIIATALIRAAGTKMTAGVYLLFTASIAAVAAVPATRRVGYRSSGPKPRRWCAVMPSEAIAARCAAVP